jgi:formylmethanofuran dehydrogenase subunit C
MEILGYAMSSGTIDVKSNVLQALGIHSQDGPD